MQFTHATRSPRASQIAGRVVCGSKVDIAEGVSARDSVAMEKSFLQLAFEVLVRCNSKPNSTPRLPPTALVVHSCERTTAIGNRKVCCSCFFRWSMVMACSSMHRRDDTLDLVQCPKTRQDYTCIYHYVCCCCCCCFLTLTDPLRIQPWSQDRRNQTKSNRESEMGMESRQKRTDKK